MPDIKNQARVHLWYKEKFGRGIGSYINIYHAIDTFPTTSTTIGFLATHQSFIIYSTFGLGDLMSMQLRPNKVKITKDIHYVKKNRPHKIWPKVIIHKW